MPIWAWILSYLANAALWVWILAFGGAARLEGSWWASLLLGRLWAKDWDEETLRAAALVFLIGSTLWFIAGLVVPQIRFD